MSENNLHRKSQQHAYLLLPCKILYSHRERLGEGSGRGVGWKRVRFAPFLPLSQPQFNISGTPLIQHIVHATSLWSPTSQKGQYLGLRLSDKAWLVPSGTRTPFLLWALGSEPEEVGVCVSVYTYSPNQQTSSLPRKVGPGLWHKQNSVPKPNHRYTHSVSHRNALIVQHIIHLFVHSTGNY